ncbi:hypothetical protein V8E54_010315 [Elaphomyces granulatus]
MPYWDNYSPTPSSDSDDSGNDDTPGVSGPSQGKDNGGTQAVLGDLLRLGHIKNRHYDEEQIPTNVRYQLEQQRRKQRDEEKWESLYKILFPGEIPPCPFVTDSSLASQGLASHPWTCYWISPSPEQQICTKKINHINTILTDEGYLSGLSDDEFRKYLAMHCSCIHTRSRARLLLVQLRQKITGIPGKSPASKRLAHHILEKQDFDTKYYPMDDLYVPLQNGRSSLVVTAKYEGYYMVALMVKVIDSLDHNGSGLVMNMPDIIESITAKQKIQLPRNWSQQTVLRCFCDLLHWHRILLCAYGKRLAGIQRHPGDLTDATLYQQHCHAVVTGQAMVLYSRLHLVP